MIIYKAWDVYQRLQYKHTWSNISLPVCTYVSLYILPHNNLKQSVEWIPIQKIIPKGYWILFSPKVQAYRYQWWLDTGSFSAKAILEPFETCLLSSSSLWTLLLIYTSCMRTYIVPLLRKSADQPTLFYEHAISQRFIVKTKTSAKNVQQIYNMAEYFQDENALKPTICSALLTCPLCSSKRKSFTCDSCIQSGNFGHSNGKYSER